MGTGSARRSVWQLAVVIPRLLAGVALAAVLLRFLPVDLWPFRAWEALTAARPLGMAFEPNQRYHNARSYGDLAARGNLPGLRQYRAERFTTDALGFRNSPDLLREEISAILAGDSFAAGSGVSDDETLSAQLSALTGCLVYNAGSDAGRVVPHEIVAVAHELKMRGRLVIRLYSEGADMPVISSLARVVSSKLESRMTAGVRGVLGRLRGFATVSPLQILSARVWKTLGDDKTLPNRYASRVVKATLSDGDVMLFHESPGVPQDRWRNVEWDYWLRLRDELRQAQLDLLVVLVPNKYRIYQPFLVELSGRQGPGNDLDRVDRGLRAAGISVLNLTPYLSAEAQRAYEHREYVYWLDDIHWNVRGIAVAAAAIRDHWPQPSSSCSAPRTQIGLKR